MRFVIAAGLLILSLSTAYAEGPSPSVEDIVIRALSESVAAREMELRKLRTDHAQSQARSEATAQWWKAYIAGLPQ